MLKQSISRKSSNRTKTITRNATCCELFDSNEEDHCCNICAREVDVLTRAKKAKKEMKTNVSTKDTCSLVCTHAPLMLLGHYTI